MNYFLMFSKYIAICCAVRGEYWKILCFSFCTSKYYPHICSAKQLRILFVPRASVNAHEIRGLFLCPCISFS